MAVDPVRLAGWLGVPSVEVRPLGEGHSNLTYLVAVPEGGSRREYVLRRPPLGPLLPTAHDVVREFRVMSLLRGQGGVRVPSVASLCEDPEVIGAPFYLMERADGEVVRDVAPDWLATPEDRRALGLDVARTLAEIHVADWQPLVAAGIGKPSGYLARQLRRWVGQREGIQRAVAAAGGQARELPDYDAVRDWLVENLPEESEPAVVHGDFKLDNVIVRHTTGQTPSVSAVVDWEMATVGDPRADLGYLLSFWPEAGEVIPLTTLPQSEGGFPSRAELQGEWEARTERQAGDTRWFVAFAVWKLAILLEASYHRWLAGMADDPFFAGLDTGVPALLSRARTEAGLT